MWNHDISSRDNLLKSLQHINDKFEHFRERWYEEYLLSLREFSRDLFQTDWSNRVRIGDVVLIQSPTKPRPYWQMGVVENLIEGDDGKVRIVTVRSGTGQINNYSINRLYPIELSITHGENKSENNSGDNQDTPQSESEARPSNNSRPQRLAAVKTRQQFQNQFYNTVMPFKGNTASFGGNI